MFKKILVSALLLLFIFTLPIHADNHKIQFSTNSQTALEHFLKGREFADNIQFDDAASEYKKAIKADPDFALAYLQLAFTDQGNSFNETYELFQKAKSLLPNVTEAEKLMILSSEAGLNANTIRQRLYLRQIVSLHPEDEWAHYLLANHFFGQQQNEIAIREYERCLELNPEYSPVYNQLGYAYRRTDNFEKAEENFKKYIELIPNNPNPYDSYAELLMKMGKFDQSIEWYLKALEVNNDFTPSRVGIINNYIHKGDYVSARSEADKLYDVVSNIGQKRQAHFLKMLAYLHDGDYTSALNEIKKRMELAKSDDASLMSSDYVMMGNIFLEENKLEEAGEMFRNATELIENSDLPTELKYNNKRFNYFRLARIAALNSDFDEADDYAKKFKKEAEKTHDVSLIRVYHNLAGYVALSNEDYEKTIAELEQGSPNSAYNFYHMAKAYEALGDKQKAREFYDKTINHNSLSNFSLAIVKQKAIRALANI